MSDILTYFGTPSQGKGLNAINDMTSQILGILLTIGYVAALIMTLYIGIRYMIAKPAERSQLKTSLTYVMIGAILFVCGSTFLGIVGGLFTDFGNSIKANL